MNKHSNVRFGVYAVLLIVESLAFSYFAGTAFFQTKIRYTDADDVLRIEFAPGQEALLKDIDRMVLFCGTESEPEMFKNPKLAVDIKLDSDGEKTVYEAARIPARTFRFRLEFMFKNGVTDTRRWPVVGRLSFGDYDIDPADVTRYYYEPRQRPSYECNRTVERPFGGNLPKMSLLAVAFLVVVVSIHRLLVWSDARVRSSKVA